MPNTLLWAFVFGVVTVAVGVALGRLLYDFIAKMAGPDHQDAA